VGAHDAVSGELESLRDELGRLRDLEEIKQLKARYCRLVDLKDWASWKELLTEDFRLESSGGVHDGRDAAVTMVSTALADASTVHHVFPAEITITGPDTAEAIWPMEDWVRLERDGKPIAFHGTGHYHEEYVRTAAGWRVRRSVQTRLRVDPIEPVS
jgi:hypothetical protein